MIPASKTATDGASEYLLRQYLSLPTNQREQEFPSTTKAAKRVGVSPRTIQPWIEDGKIKAIPIGRKYKVHFESLLAYIECHIRAEE
ncbi:MAG: helix-turn-helix domain-containing protein [Nitrososphaera sp.]|nr:helix-turn-helix domain-containing protein [Nitrososphaera sp.]